MKKEISYISYYSLSNDFQKRRSVLACTNKMNSIIEALVDIGYSVNIISASNSDLNHICCGRTDCLSSKVTLKFFKSFPWKNLFFKVLCRLSIFGGLFLYLIKLKKEDRVIVYHSLNYMSIIKYAHRIKKFHLILEIEEIYADVMNNKELKNKELEYFQEADSYIFPTYNFNQTINKNNKPSVIIHGTYKSERKRNKKIFSTVPGIDSSKVIHCVYAGTFDSRKGGCIAAITTAEFLPKNYNIHIIGFGNKEDTQNIKNLIYEVNKKNKAHVFFDGLRSGEEYITFIQSCDIGLSTQNPDSAFNSTSFPSKILSYMANGLRVVSARIPVVENSDVGDLIYYYDKQTPENIAHEILMIDLNNEYDSRKRICDLNDKFKKDLIHNLLK